MKIVEVNSKSLIQEFLLFPVKLYKNDSKWIRPLDKDIEQVFDREKNKTFRHGDAIRWILVDDQNKTIGRVAAFVNDKITTRGNDQPTGGMGFFECIDDQKAAFILFDQCKQWLQSKGMEAMDGPINFGTRDAWWGLLVDGFEREPNYRCNYNFPYYKDFFEAYGFQLYFNQYTFYRTIEGPLTPRLHEKAELMAKEPDYEFRHIRKDEIEKLHEYLFTVYNKAWSKREAPELTLAQSKLIVKQMKPILDIRLVYFGFYKGEPISFFISLPEMNQVFKHVNGKLNLPGIIKFLWHQKIVKSNRKAFGVLFGVVPGHQGKGCDGAMVLASRKVLQDEYKRYDEYEMNWIGDFNPRMINVVEQVNVTRCKTHVTYRKLFDETKPFKRSQIFY